MLKFNLIKYLPIIGIIFLTCTIKMSPHAQNEIFNPFTKEDESGEFGAGMAINQWIHKEESNTIYIQTYPQGSLDVLYKAYKKSGRFTGFGGLEGIFPIAWDISDGNFLLWIKMHLGGQLEFPYLSFRFNFLPSFWFWRENGKLKLDEGWSKLDLYQLTLLVHNMRKTNPGGWFGIRNSSSALGFLAGCEYNINSGSCLRFEYSFLRRTPFSLLLTKDDLNSLEGSVHYFTLGVFKRIK